MIAAKTYCWIGNDGGWKVGRKVWNFFDCDCTIMRLYHTGEIVIVDPCDLQPYPQSPIPEPTK